jgi:hypothetical protein
LRRLLLTIGGLWELARLASLTRFRMGGRYWQWRRETAFGAHPDRIPAAERRRAILEYARWVYRMRRLQ